MCYNNLFPATLGIKFIAWFSHRDYNLRTLLVVVVVIIITIIIFIFWYIQVHPRDFCFSNISPLWSLWWLRGLCHRLNVKCIHTHFPVWSDSLINMNQVLTWETLFAFHSQITFFSFSHNGTPHPTKTIAYRVRETVHIKNCAVRLILYNLTIGNDNLLFIFLSLSYSSLRFVFLLDKSTFINKNENCLTFISYEWICTLKCECVCVCLSITRWLSIGNQIT